MKRSRAFGVVLILMVAFVFSPAEADADRSFAEVTLTYNEGGTPCITATPDHVTIYWNRKPKKVKWVTESRDDLYWEIDWKGSADQPNYFGKNFKMKRGEKFKDSDKPKKYGRSGPGASWSYMIRVYETSDSVERGRLLCELDPAVDWGD